MDNTRPEPVGMTPFTRRNGQVIQKPIYDPAEVGAYRRAHGVSQRDLANRLNTSQSAISNMENGRRPVLDARTAVEVLDAIEFLGAYRARIIAKGLADLSEIRAARKAGVVVPIRDGRARRASPDERRAAAR